MFVLLRDWSLNTGMGLEKIGVGWAILFMHEKKDSDRGELRVLSKENFLAKWPWVQNRK